MDIFFNATASRAATGRTITSYIWEFGDGTGASGPIVTHKFANVGKGALGLFQAGEVEVTGGGH